MIKKSLPMLAKQTLCVLLMCLPLLTPAQGINFTEGLSWEQVKQKAKTENKYIFIDCYATWCAPCKYMDKKVYPNDTVGRSFNEKFVSVKVQMDTSKADNELIKNWYADANMLKKKYKVTAFPTFLFFSPNGNLVHRETGQKSIKNFITIGDEALNSEKQYYTLLEKYNKNELDTAFMKYLARKAKDVEGDELARKVANDYINRLTTNAVFTQDNIRFMHEFTKSSKDRGFIIFRDSARRISEIDERITERISKNIVLDIIYKEEIKPYRSAKKGKPDWKKIKSNLKKYGSLGEEALTNYKPGIIFKTEIEPALKINSDWNKILPLIEKQKLGRNSEFVVGSTVVYYLNGVATNHTEKDCKNLVAAATYYADSFPSFLNARALNTWAWVIFENSTDRQELNKGLAWSKKSLELHADSPEPEILDTYANLLYKLGHVQEAIVWQEKAVQAAKGRAPSFQQTLVKMQKGEKTWPEK